MINCGQKDQATYAEHRVKAEDSLWILVVVSQQDVVVFVDTQVLPGRHMAQAHLLLPPDDVP